MLYYGLEIIRIQNYVLLVAITLNEHFENLRKLIFFMIIILLVPTKIFCKYLDI